jgi:hypothetical protein
LSKRVLNTRLPKDYISIKMSLKNYNGLTDLRKHVQNMSGSLELVINDNDSMCKILLITFWGFAHAWYNNLEPNSIKRFSDLCTKLMDRFNTNIPVKKSFTDYLVLLNKRTSLLKHI